MKKEFSTSWKSSKQPRKQVKYAANAPLHLKRKMLGSNLSKELRKKFGKRTLPLKKGDTVKIMIGKFKGKQGKVVNTHVKKLKVEIEGIQVKKQDGSKVNIKLRPSNLQIIELNVEDKRRSKILKKDSKSEEKKKEAGEKIKESDESKKIEMKKVIKNEKSDKDGGKK